MNLSYSVRVDGIYADANEIGHRVPEFRVTNDYVEITLRRWLAYLRRLGYKPEHYSGCVPYESRFSGAQALLSYGAIVTQKFPKSMTSLFLLPRSDPKFTFCVACRKFVSDVTAKTCFVSHTKERLRADKLLDLAVRRDVVYADHDTVIATLKKAVSSDTRFYGYYYSCCGTNDHFSCPARVHVPRNPFHMEQESISLVLYTAVGAIQTRYSLDKLPEIMEQDLLDPYTMPLEKVVSKVPREKLLEVKK